MARLPEEWISSLLDRVSIRDVVSRYVDLKEKGGRYWGSCPFHPDKTPSFSVSPDKGMFYCFSCHRGGSVIQFVTEIEHIGYREACEKLAEDAGLALPTEAFSQQSRAKRKKELRLTDLNRAAARFFAAQLSTPAGREALLYLRGRGLNDRDIRRNGLGFAPDSWHALGAHLASLGFSEKELLEAGLQKTKNGNTYDIFRNRAMFPIFDVKNRVIGFGGRVMDGSEPKYLNSSETPVFNKRKNLYHLNVARSDHSSGILLMEGYMDVVSASHYGIDSAVASLGTALTRDQVWMLKRTGRPVYICYDGDAPGVHAAVRAARLLGKDGVENRVISIPGGADPDDYLRANGREAFEALVHKAEDPVLFQFHEAASRFNLEIPAQNVAFMREAIGILRELPGSVAREQYARALAEQAGCSLQAVLSELSADGEKTAVTVPSGGRKSRRITSGETMDQKAENYVAAYAAAFPDRLPVLLSVVDASDFADQRNAAIFEVAATLVQKGAMPGPGEILAGLADNTDARNHAARLFESTEHMTGNGRQPHMYVRGCIARMKLREKQRELGECRLAYAKAVQAGASVQILTELGGKLRSLQQEAGGLRRESAGLARQGEGGTQL